MTAEEMSNIAARVWGIDWQQPLAVYLDVPGDLISRWQSGVEIPETLVRKILPLQQPLTAADAHVYTWMIKLWHSSTALRLSPDDIFASVLARVSELMLEHKGNEATKASLIELIGMIDEKF